MSLRTLARMRDSAVRVDQPASAGWLLRPLTSAPLLHRTCHCHSPWRCRLARISVMTSSWALAARSLFLVAVSVGFAAPASDLSSPLSLDCDDHVDAFFVRLAFCLPWLAVS